MHNLRITNGMLLERAIVGIFRILGNKIRRVRSDCFYSIKGISSIASMANSYILRWSPCSMQSPDSAAPSLFYVLK